MKADYTSRDVPVAVCPVCHVIWPLWEDGRLMDHPRMPGPHGIYLAYHFWYEQVTKKLDLVRGDWVHQPLVTENLLTLEALNRWYQSFRVPCSGEGRMTPMSKEEVDAHDSVIEHKRREAKRQEVLLTEVMGIAKKLTEPCRLRLYDYDYLDRLIETGDAETPPTPETDAPST
jgi:hypothetical protein